MCSIVLAGGSLVGLSRGSWDAEYQVLERVPVAINTEDLNQEEPPEIQFEPEVLPRFTNPGGCQMSDMTLWGSQSYDEILEP